MGQTAYIEDKKLVKMWLILILRKVGLIEQRIETQISRRFI